MSTGPRYKVPFRRRRECVTDYHHRRRILMGRTTRLVVRKSLKKITAQLIDYKATGDIVVASASSKELEKFGWKGSIKNMPAAYLTGLIIAKRGTNAKIEDAVLDLGLKDPVPGSLPFAVVKGAQDGGLGIPMSEKVTPSDERIAGEHINEEIKGLFDTVKTAIEEATL